MPSPGSAATFLIARYLARGWVARRIARYPRFAAVDRAVGADGLRIVFLLRLSPVFPFNLLNYALGATRVRFRDYLLGALGMLPGTFLYVYLGSLGAGVAIGASEVGGGGDGDGGVGTVVKLALQAVGALATLAVTVVVARIAKQALAQTTGVSDDASANANANADTNTSADANANTNTDANTNTTADTNANTNANTNPRAGDAS